MKTIRPKIALRGFNLGGSGAGHVLGGLDSAVMETLWANSAQTVNDVEERLKNKRGIAHTTVLTTLDRLHRKGYLLREKHAKAFIYSPRYSREEFERKLAQEVLGALIGHFTQPALSTFVELIGEDAGALDQVEALIRAKRREQARSKKED